VNQWLRRSARESASANVHKKIRKDHDEDKDEKEDNFGAHDVAASWCYDQVICIAVPI
jgi:hypothetical protein